MTYRKIFKWLLGILFIVGVVTSAYGFIKGWPGTDEWKGDLATAAELKDVVATMEANGTESLEGAALEQRKAEIAAVKAARADIVAQHKALSESSANLRKNSAAQKEAVAKEKELLAAQDSLMGVEQELQSAVTLTENKAKLAEVEAKIAAGEGPVDVILISTYIMMGLTLLALCVILFVINGINSPMGLLKLVLGLVAIALLVWGAWAIAPGDMIQSETLTPDQISTTDLKMTDTILYLAYLLFGCTLVALVTSWIVGAVRK